MKLSFEGDAGKARANERKHRVSFEEAQTVFLDAFALVVSDGEHSWDEERLIIIGMSLRDRLLTVVYVDREGLTLRLISARRATSRERRDYEEKADR